LPRSAGAAAQETSLSKPPLTNWTRATPPPVNPAAPQRDWASASELAPASQLGSAANTPVEPVIVCHWLPVE
jgi:hypothetical protein